MSVINVETRRFANYNVIAKHTERTGWGIFAETDFAEGETLYVLHAHDTPHSTIVKWKDSFGECYDRGFTIIPDFAMCCVATHPFWNMNHSCNPNAGFVRWGRVENGTVAIAAHRRIRKGEQITADYATFTTCYDGTYDGQGWEMTPCLCGEANCRGKVTGFEALPLDLQMKMITVHGAARGQVLAHILHDLPDLEATLRSEAPELYAEYQNVLQEQYAISREWQRTIGSSTAPSPLNKGRAGR